MCRVKKIHVQEKFGLGTNIGALSTNNIIIMCPRLPGLIPMCYHTLLCTLTSPAAWMHDAFLHNPLLPMCSPSPSWMYISCNFWSVMRISITKISIFTHTVLLGPVSHPILCKNLLNGNIFLQHKLCCTFLL